MIKLDKRSEVQNLIDKRAHELWDEALNRHNLFVNPDRVKVYVENQIEGAFMCPNMWAEGWLDDVSLTAIKNLVEMISVDDMLIACKGSTTKIEGGENQW